MDVTVQQVSVFGAAPGGGNPATVVVGADRMSDAEMRAVAGTQAHETCFVLSAPADSGCDLGLRFMIAGQEMNMCGHATVGAVWLLDRWGLLAGDDVSLATASGRIEARVATGIDDTRLVEISQPPGRTHPVEDGHVPEILSVLGLTGEGLASAPIENAVTSRAKTLVPVATVSVLDRLRPDFGRVRELCDRLGSTGLYPYAPSDVAGQVFEARQFPRASGYPEDAATGVAAAALSFALLDRGLVRAGDRPVVIRQGRVMGRPSQISVRFAVNSGRVTGCWLGGEARLDGS